MMILIAAAIASLASLLLIGGYISWRATATERAILAFLVLIHLPTSPFVFYALRLPLDGLLERIGFDAGTRRFLAVLYRPVFEELLKLWPLVLPFVWRSNTQDNKLWRALAMGLGFGIGETWMLAEIVHRTDPATANLDLLTLTGFINERMMVCLIHGALTGLVVMQFGTGLPVAIVLHTIGNIPFYLREVSAFGFSAGTWATLVRAWVLWYFFGICLLLSSLAGTDFHALWLLFGDATCPFCGMVYPRATLTWTLRVVHHDHCPRCQRRISDE